MPPATAAGVRPRRGSPGLRAGAALGILLGGLLGPGREVAARHHHARAHEPAAKPGAKPGAKEDRNSEVPKGQGSAKEQKDSSAIKALLEQGRAALASKDYAAAQSAFTAAYRQAPGPEALFQLGALAAAEHRGVAARDLLRRYLQEAAGEAESPEQKEAQRIVELDPGASGEINILGTRGALVLVDDRLVGALPLPLPLLVPLGTHKVTVELGAQRVEESLKILSGQVAQMRVNQRTGVVVVSLPPAIILLPEGSGGAAVAKLVTQAMKEAAVKERSAVVSRDQAVAQAPALAGCLDKLTCQLDLVAQNETPYALRVRLSGGPGRGPWQLELNLIDGGVGAVAATATPSCADCTPEQAAAAAAATLGPLLQEAASRSRGTVEINSQPSGAEVYLAGDKVGLTPYRASRLVGEYSVKVQKAGQQSYEAPLVVTDGKTAALNVVLADMTEIEPPPAELITSGLVLGRQPRPLWRVITGAALLGGGALLVGFGASALSVDGQCNLESAPALCDSRYSTLVPGSLLVGAGALLLVGGITLVAIPGARKKVSVSAGLSPLSGSGSGVPLRVGLRF